MIKLSSQYDTDFGATSRASTLGVNKHSRRPFTNQHSQYSARMQNIKQYTYVTVLAETSLNVHISEMYIFILLRSPSLTEHDKLSTFFIRLTSKKL